jgi:hypothetical protein
MLVYGDDLTTRDGKVYHGYKVLSHDAGFVTIMYSDGGGKIPLSQLPDDLQKKYGYNKAQADAFVQAAIAQERRDRQAIVDEERKRQLELASQAAAPLAASMPQTPGVAQPATNQAPATAITQVAPDAGPSVAITQVAPDAGTSGAVTQVAPDVGNSFVPADPAQMTDAQRKVAIAALTDQISKLKDVIRAEKTAKAKQAVLNYLRGQGSANPVSMTTAQDGELARLRIKRHQLKISAPPQPKPPLTNDEAADVRAKIRKLKDNIRDMQEQLDRHLFWDPGSFDYPDVIEDDTDQIAMLRAELPETAVDWRDADSASVLASMPDLGVPATGPLSDQDAQVVKQKIKDLQDDVDFMKKEEARNTNPQTGQVSSNVPHGGFADKITHEIAQIDALTARLSQTQ